MSDELQPEDDHEADAAFYRQVFAPKPDPAAAMIGRTIADAGAHRAAEAAQRRSRSTARHRRAAWQLIAEPPRSHSGVMPEAPPDPVYPGRGGHSNI
jgi:hypothetical protein